MFSSDDIVVDPAQQWDFYKLFPGSKKIHNCPIWNRLSGWAGTDDGMCAVTGSNTEARMGAHVHLEDTIRITDYARRMNINLNTLTSIVYKHKPKYAVKYMLLFKIADLDGLCEKYYPADNLVSHADAVAILKHASRLPEPKWHIGKSKYYDENECYEIYKKIREEIETKKQHQEELRKEKAKKEKEKYLNKEKETKIVVVKKRYIIGIPKEKIKIPDGYISLPDACKKYNVRNSTMTRSYSKKKIGGMKIDGKIYLVEKQAAEYGEILNKPAPQIPDGWILAVEAKRIANMRDSTYTMLRKRKKFPSMAYKNTSYVDKEAFFDYVRKSKKLSKQLELL